MWKSSGVMVVSQAPHLGFCRSTVAGSPPIHPRGNYAEVVSSRVSHPPIPVEVLARRATLQAALKRMESVGPNREPACLQGLLALTFEGLDAVVDAIRSAGLEEEAHEQLRSSRPEAGGPAASLLSRLAPLAAAARQRRTALWQLDSRRALIRFSYAKEGPALDFDDGDLHALFLQAFRLEGLGLALDLGKRPRPSLCVGLPLATGIGSRGEFMDALLKREPAEAPGELMARLNRRLPEGVHIHQWTQLPGYATPVSELARRSHWAWKADAVLRVRVEARVAAFLQAETWIWDRGIPKAEAALDLRTIVSGMEWTGEELRFETRMDSHQALNPLKLLGAVLDLDPTAVKGLVRAGVDLDPDPRLGQADRFEPKLKNMYEDAVLLAGGSNITLVDEDDDEPIHLG